MKQNYKKILDLLLLELAKKTNNAISKKEAIGKGLDKYLALDYYPLYGGYNLIAIDIHTGGHYEAFKSFSSCGNRLKAPVMVEKIRSFIAGLDY